MPRNDTPLVLAIDSGTSSVRASLFELDGTAVRGSLAKVGREFRSDSSGIFEIDADAAFGQVLSAIDAALTRTRRPISHVAMCSFWHSLVGIDERGKPTTAILGWADRRSRDATATLKAKFDENELHGRTGAHFHSSFWPAKLLWLRTHEANAWGRTARWIGHGDDIARRLLGEAVTSVSMASATGIFDQRRCDWDNELLRYLRVKRATLPRIAHSGESFRLVPKYRKRLPQLAQARFFPAMGDGAADNIGSGCVGAGRAALMVGTSAAVRVAYKGEPPRELPSGLWSYRIDETRVVVGGALSDGGNLYDFIRKRFGLKGDLDALLSARPAADELVVIPFFFGERSTGYDENARGAIVGLTAANDGIDVLRAAMEGVAFRLADIVERLETLAPIVEIVASGGALKRSRVWGEMIADVLGRDLTLSDAPETALKGAVLLALESLGKIETIDQ